VRDSDAVCCYRRRLAGGLGMDYTLWHATFVRANSMNTPLSPPTRTSRAPSLLHFVRQPGMQRFHTALVREPSVDCKIKRIHTKVLGCSLVAQKHHSTQKKARQASHRPFTARAAEAPWATRQTRAGGRVGWPLHLHRL